MTKSMLSKQEGPFYSSWEALTLEEKYPVIRQKLLNVVEHARTKSPFYFDRLLGVDKKSEYPLSNVPVLESSDLRKQLPPFGTDLLTKDTLNYSVFQSGGTTGTPKTSLFTAEDMDLINLCNARGFYAVGLSEEDRVANLWAVGGLYMTFVHMNTILQGYGCQNFPFSNQTPPEYVYEVAKLFDINCFTGITSVVLNCLREIRRTKKEALKIQKVFFGGEHIYDSDRRELQEEFGVEVIKAPGYGTVDTWYIGYQCSRTENGVFHLFDDMVYAEIVDEETGEHCPPGEAGMLYVTVLPRTLTPIIRYRVGDRARWLESSCRCGRTSPMFQLLGRGDDVLRVGYDSIDYGFVQQIAGNIDGLNGRLQMKKDRIGGKDKLTLIAESKLPEDHYESQKALFVNQFMDKRISFKEFVKKGTVEPLDVQIVKESTIPHNPRTGKLVRVIDSV